MSLLDYWKKMSQNPEKNICFEKWETRIKSVLFKGRYLFQDRYLYYD